MTESRYVRPDFRIGWWRQLRWQVMDRAGGICEICFKEPATQLHHVCYPTGRREQLRDLCAVCNRCHSRLHDRVAANDNSPQLDLPLTGTDDC
jgi:hypothetical protein